MLPVQTRKKNREPDAIAVNLLSTSKNCGRMCVVHLFMLQFLSIVFRLPDFSLPFLPSIQPEQNATALQNIQTTEQI